MGIIYPQISQINADYFFRLKAYPQITQITQILKTINKRLCSRDFEPKLIKSPIPILDAFK
jgi:hypothetical protein